MKPTPPTADSVRITERAKREYQRLLLGYLRSRLATLDDDARSVCDLRRDLAAATAPVLTAGGLLVYSGPPPMDLRLVFDPKTGSLLSVLPPMDPET